MMTDLSTRLLMTALAEWGVAETAGPKATHRIAEFLVAAGLPANDEIAWCSAFMYWLASELSLERPALAKAPAARSWLLVGRPVPVRDPEMGNVVVLSRGDPAGWQAHVGLFVSWSADRERVYVLGGNQTNNVNISPYPTSRVLGFRALSLSTAEQFT